MAPSRTEIVDSLGVSLLEEHTGAEYFIANNMLLWVKPDHKANGICCFSRSRPQVGLRFPWKLRRNTLHIPVYRIDEQTAWIRLHKVSQCLESPAPVGSTFQFLRTTASRQHKEFYQSCEKLNDDLFGKWDFRLWLVCVILGKYAIKK